MLIADGHHRYEVACAYREENPAADGVMTYIVELAPDQLTVRGIHRLLPRRRRADLMTAARALVRRRATDRDPVELGPDLPTSAHWRWYAGGHLAAAPHAAVVDKAEHDLDSARLDVALAELDGVDVAFQHGWDLADRSRSARGQVDAAVLLRPVTVEQIAAISHGGERMPPKSTFFFPKPRTGLVFREVAPAGASPDPG